jgi:cystathionine gamma-synthase/O-acetylhomoserine (thiol)-lyase
VGVSERAQPSRYGAGVEQDALVPPVLHASTYVVDSAQELADLLDGTREGYSYARIDSPTADAFAGAVAAAEKPADTEVAAQAFASGMAAISTSLLELLEPGDHVVAAASCYGGTYQLLRGILARFGVVTTFADQTDPAAIARAATGRTRVIWAESFANPTMLMADLPALADVAHDCDALLAVDSTFASPAMLRPLEWGADLVVHSATKYLGGHSDATGGVVVGEPELVSRIRAARAELGPVLAPDEAYLLHRGLATLDVRVARQCATATFLAAALADHPALARVDHPSLPSHPSHEVALRLCDKDRYGAVLALSPRGGREQGMAFCDALRTIPQATSLGGTHTTASHAASSSHRQFDDAALAAAGLLPSLVRLSVGLEDPSALLEDLVGALDSLDA